VPEDSPQEAPQGAVPLAAAIGALREELTRTWLDGQNKSVRFKPLSVELTLQAAVTTATKGSAKVKWWLVELGGELSRQSVATQMVKLTFEPRFLDHTTGGSREMLLDAADAPGRSHKPSPVEVLHDQGHCVLGLVVCDDGDGLGRVARVMS
jgi:Trypsin-co-occurring domain 2